MKKLKIILISLCFVCIFATSAQADDNFYYTDIIGHWAESDIYYMTNRDVLNGYPDGTFRPDRTVTRGELINILAKDAKADTDAYANSNRFTDIRTHWAKNAINWGAATGVVDGYADGTFKPDAPILREEMAVMLNRYLQGKGLEYKYPEDPFNDTGSISSWARAAVTSMQRYGLIEGRGNHEFTPRGTATRGETATIMARYIRSLNGETLRGTVANIYVNNTLVKSDVKVAAASSGTMVAIRDFFEAMGCRVAYYQDTSLVAAYDSRSHMEMWVGKTTAYAGGEKIYLTTPPYIFEGSTLAPLRDITSALNLSVVENNTATESRINILTTPVSTAPNRYSFYGEAGSGGVNGEAHLRDSGGFRGNIEGGVMTYGSYTSSDGYRYFGGWVNSQFSGEGTAINPRGELSVGTFANGYMTNGITYFADGSTFEGEWYYNTTTSAIYPSKGVLTANGSTYGSAATDWSGGALAASRW